MTHDREQDDADAGEQDELSARGSLTPPALAHRTRHIAERHSPAYMVLDDRGDVVHASGPTSPFLEPGTGSATLNLLDLVHRDLRDGLRIAVRKAGAEKQPATFDGVMGNGGPDVHVRVIVEPVDDDADDSAFFVVLFQQKQRAGDEPDAADRIHRLEEELRHTRERLHGLGNLLRGTQIAAMVLDAELRIASFTPAIADIVPLTDGDIGRPITHLSTWIVHDTLAADAQCALLTLATVERNVEHGRSGSRYLLRFLPHCSSDNVTAGVVLTFHDLSATDKALRESEERFRMMAQTVPNIMFAARPDGWCEYVNARFYDYTGMPDGSALGEGWMLAVHLEDIEDTRHLWQRSIETGEHFEAARRIRDAGGAYRWFRVRAEPMRGANGEIVRWFGSCSDIHEYQMASDRQRLLVAELQHRVKNILAVIRSIFTRSMEAAGATEAGADHFRGRLDALARTQNVLTRTPEGGIDLEEMIQNELTCHGSLNGQQVHIDGPPVRLRQKAAEALGLAVHELATNAAKYGALATGSGRIGVTWQLFQGGAGPHLSWQWTESGVSLIDPAPARIGFGRELIEHGLPYQLGATTTLNFARGGISCAIELPLSERLAVLPKGDLEWRQP